MERPDLETARPVEPERRRLRFDAAHVETAAQALLRPHFPPRRTEPPDEGQREA